MEREEEAGEEEEVVVAVGEEEMGGDDGGGGGEAEGVRVLVVDDSLLDRKVVERLLLRSEFDFEVSAVDSARKAMEVLGLTAAKKAEPHAFDDRKIDLVLTDYFMPEMDGYGLLKAIKENASSRSIPVVIMSSENDSQRISSCIANGAEDFMIKPLQAGHLQRLINHARPQATSAPKAGTKRKLPLDVMTESNRSARRPRLAGVAVA